MPISVSEQHSDRENKNPQYKKNLYVKNLDNEMDEQKLRKLSGKYGVINSCKVSE